MCISTAILYDCAELPGGCSSCTSFRLVEGFECGWCQRPIVNAPDSCHLLQECSVIGTIANEGRDCPAPTIIDFSPKSGPLEGGTTITITGRELGVSFDDFTDNSITVGNIPCTLVNTSYIPGRQALCTTGRLISPTNTILIRLHSQAITSHDLFRVATPEIFRATPSLGPAAGGTRLTIHGVNLNIGNIEDTSIWISAANVTLDCIVE